MNYRSSAIPLYAMPLNPLDHAAANSRTDSSRRIPALLAPLPDATCPPTDLPVAMPSYQSGTDTPGRVVPDSGPVLRSPAGAVRAPRWSGGAHAATPLGLVRLLAEAKPMWFPSVEHYEERIAQLTTYCDGVLGQARKTGSWRRCTFQSFRRYLAEGNQGDAFLRGDLAAQARCLEGWIVALRARGLAHSTIHTYWRALESSLNRIAAQDGTVSPARFVERPHPGLRRPRALPQSAVETIFTFVRNQQWDSTFERSRNLGIVGCMALAGLRRGEVLALAVADVTIENASLRIRQGKGRHGGRDRTAYMTPQLVELLTEYLAERKRLGRTNPEVFSSVQADEGIGEVTIRRLFKRITSGTGIHVTPHMLRHSYATLLRQAGVSDRVAMELLGHRSLAVLQRYSAVFDGECAAEAKRLTLNVAL